MSEKITVKAYCGDTLVRELSSTAVMVVSTDFSGTMCDCDFLDMLTLAARVTYSLKSLKAAIIDKSHGVLNEQLIEQLIKDIDIASRNVDISADKRIIADLCNRLKKGGGNL